MENEKKLINTNEISPEQRDYSKEYGYLNQLKGALNFNFYKSPVLSESNFYSTIAWYIDVLKKESGNREEKIQEFIDSIINFNGSEPEKLLFVDKFLMKEQQKRHIKKYMDYDVKLLDQILSNIDNRYKKGEGHIRAITGTKPSMIPERYFKRFTESGLEEKVMNKNRENFISAMRHGAEKAEKLKNKL